MAENVNGKCSECGAGVARSSNGELVCMKCGLVIEEAFYSGQVLL